MESRMITEREEKPLIAKFKISKEEAFSEYAKWTSCQKYVPRDFNVHSLEDKIKKLFVPVDLIEASAESSWHGNNYHTEYRTVTKTDSSGKKYVDSEEYDVPDPIAGMNYNNYYLSITASSRMSQDEINKLAYDVKRSEFQIYDESYLDGSDVWAVDLNKTDVLEICKRRIDKLEVEACSRKVYELLGCSTKPTFRDSHFALLPMYILTYEYKGDRFGNLINGRSGKVIGSMPVDTRMKFLVQVLQIIGVIMVLIILFHFL